MNNEQVELELCGNCKREIPHHNYVMHTAHCARNISLCPKCKEPIPKLKVDQHAKVCNPQLKTSIPTPTKLEQSAYFAACKDIEDKKAQVRKEKQMEKMEKLVGPGKQLGRSTLESNPVKRSILLPCQYCELELPKFDLQEHEDYCGARTEKCQDCGEMVMFKYRQLHYDTNHGVLNPEVKQRHQPTPLNIAASYNPAGGSLLRMTDSNGEKLESSKEISRRLDCKTEYIRNLLHDTASITAPIRSTGAIPRYRSTVLESPLRYRMPPTVLVIPCEFCNVPVPQDDLIEHETGCRPDLARYNPRRNNNSPDRFAQEADVELPCEFCSDLIPASRLLSHQASCNC